MTLAAAHHEAGHAVVGRALGFGVSLVTLEHEGPPGTASAWTQAARGPNPAPPPGAVVPLTRALALRSAVYSLAGPTAEARVSRRSLVAVLEAPPACRDLAAVRTELPDAFDRARALEGARLLVLHWWAEIREVAQALQEARTLDGPTLAALLPAELRARSPGHLPAELPSALACRLWEQTQ